jgi:hypothetical protein
VWIFLGILSVILLVIYFRKSKNSVWGGLTIGIPVGLVLTIIGFFKGNGFNWLIIVRVAIITTLLGFIADLLGSLSDLIKKKYK